MSEAIVVYKDYVQRHSWIRWMIGRTKKQNKNNLIAVVGKTGSGKTYTAISICELMAKQDKVPFTIDHVVFSLRELMELINSGVLKRGSKIVFDEPQVSISARDFQSEANKVFNFLLSTFRHRNLTLFFCTPYETLLDKNTRKLFHGRFETVSIDTKTNTCRIKPRYIEYTDFKAEPYRKRIIVMYKDKDGSRQVDKLSFWNVPKPSQEFIELYEQKKLDFTNNLNENITRRLKKFDESGKSITSEYVEPVKERKPLTERQEQVLKLLVNNTQEEAAKILGVKQGAISEVKRGAEKKGYSVEEFKKSEEKEEKVIQK